MRADRSHCVLQYRAQQASTYAPQGSSKNSDALRDRSSSQGNNAKLLVRGGSKCHPFSTLNPETQTAAYPLC